MKIKYLDKNYDVLKIVESKTNRGPTGYIIEIDPGHFQTVYDYNVNVIDNSPIDNEVITKTLDMLSTSIDAMRYELSTLYDLQSSLKKQFTIGNLEFNKLYKFYNINGNDDSPEEDVYYGVINKIVANEGYYTVYYCGINNNLIHGAQNFEDCQYASFDADGVIDISSNDLEAFINHCTPITEEEYYKAVENLYNNIINRSKYWFNKYIK